MLLIAVASHTASATSIIDTLRTRFIQASITPYAHTPQETEAFIRYSEHGRANDVLLLQLYTYVLLPDSEVNALLAAWNGSQFTDIDYNDASRGRWQPSLHVTRLLALSKVYANPGSKWYKNPQLHDLLHNGMKWWFDNTPVCLNWWHNEIGVPKKMAALMLVMYDELTPDELERGSRIIGKSTFGMTGQNKTWRAGNQLMLGLLNSDEDLVLKAKNVIAEEIVISSDEGIQSDWSFHQHGPQIQSGNYGLAYLEGMSFWYRVLKGTSFDFSAPQREIIKNFATEGSRWFVWKGEWDPNFVGRQAFPDTGSGKGCAFSVAAQNLGMQINDQFEGARYFPRSDCGTYRTPSWHASIRMHSTRTIGFENTNKENTLSNFSADGALLLMQTGEEYRNIFACWDWRKLPGTTAYNDGKPIKMRQRRKENQNNSEKVCGKVFHVDGKDVMVAAMELSRDGIHAWKTVFFFPDLIVNLGADITCSDTSVIEFTTAIEQNHLSGKARLLPDGIWHAGAAYYSLNKAPIKYSCELQKGDWGAMDPALSGRKDSCMVFKCWFEHSPSNLSESAPFSYAYAIVPGINYTKAKKSFPAVEIIENSKYRQIIRYNGITLSRDNLKDDISCLTTPLK